jgi:hypothetical protein
MHRNDGFNLVSVLRAVEGADIESSVVLKGNTDEIGYWILRGFAKFIRRVRAFAFIVV